MGLTPNEILNKEFATKFRGYDTDQVNDYLDIIVADYEKMIDEIHKLKVELSAAKEKNEYFAQLQESLNSSIVVAQEAADRLKQNARKEAELILFEAEKEADKIIIEASDRAKSIVTETEALRRSSKSYRERLENLIRNQLDIVSGEEYINLFNEEFESKLRPADFHEASTRASKRVDELENKETGFDEIDKVTEQINQSEYQTFSEDIEENSLEASSDIDTFVTNEQTIATNEEESVNSNEDDYFQDIDVENESDSFKQVDFNNEEEPDFSESVLGQTIRIELPKQND